MLSLGHGYDGHYYQDEGCRAFQRTIRDSFPDVLIVRGRGDHSLHVFARGANGHLPVMSYDAGREPSEWLKNDLDLMRRRAQRSSLERAMAREAALTEHEAQSHRTAVHQTLDETLAHPAVEQYTELASRQIAEAAPTKGMAPWSGRHTASEVSHNVFVKKYDQKTGAFDDGYKPTEAARRP